MIYDFQMLLNCFCFVFYVDGMILDNGNDVFELKMKRGVFGMSKGLGTGRFLECWVVWLGESLQELSVVEKYYQGGWWWVCNFISGVIF